MTLPFDVAPFRSAHPREMRRLIREEKWIYPTSGLCHCHVQANLIVLPKDWAYDFLVFAQRNPKPCPILDVTEPGDGEAKLIAPGSDVRTDIPRYRVWKGGELIDEPTSVAKYWREDLLVQRRLYPEITSSTVIAWRRNIPYSRAIQLFIEEINAF